MKKSYDVTLRTLSRTVEDREKKYGFNESSETLPGALDLTGNGCYNYLVLAACSITANAVALDVFSFGVVVAACACDLDLTIEQKGYLSSAPFGGILFAFPWGYYADTAGRRRAIIVSTSMGFVFAALGSLATKWYILLILKFIGCSFSAASFNISMTFLGECTTDKYRLSYMQILNSINLASEAVCFLLALYILPLEFNIHLSWLSMNYRPWRLLTFIMAVPLGISALLVMRLHESPKFLASQGHEAQSLKVLQDIYERNGGEKGTYPVKRLILSAPKELDSNQSIFERLAEQTMPIFKPPLLKRTLQLFYLLIIICSTNNVFVMWFPTMVNTFFVSLKEGDQDKSFCLRVNDNSSAIDKENTPCSEVSLHTIYSGIGYGLFYFIVNLLVSQVTRHRRLMVLVTFAVSAISCFLVDLVVQPVANLIFFVLLQCTSLLFGVTLSYFVDLFPTKNSALASSLGMMLGRISAFIGINLVGILITKYCSTVFYSWSVFVISGIIVTLFLPPDSKIHSST